MKKLIVIQNDYSAVGKTTLSLCLHNYLLSYRVAHHQVVVTETECDPFGRVTLDAGHLTPAILVEELQKSDLTIMEIESGFSEAFYAFYEKYQLDALLEEWEVSMTVMLPITGDEESFDEALTAAEVYSDAAQYLITHNPASSAYDSSDIRRWERSHAARTLDMFDAADVEMPSASDALEYQMKVRHYELPEALTHSEMDAELHVEVSKWFRKVANALGPVKNFLFGDGFRPEIVIHEPTKKTRGRRPKAAVEAAAPAAPAIAA